MSDVHDYEADPEMAGHAAALADAVDATLASWVLRCVTARASAWAGPPDPDVLAAAEVAGGRCRAEIGGEVRRLLATDIDAQRGTPLAILRRGVSYPTAVLAAAGVPPVDRDDFAARVFPDDPYDLTPGTFSDVDPALAEPGLAWGAAKAWLHKRRHSTNDVTPPTAPPGPEPPGPEPPGPEPPGPEPPGPEPPGPEAT